MRSLRGRLTLGVAAALAAVLLVSGLSVSRSVANTQAESIDERIQRTADLTRPNAIKAINDEIPLDAKRLNPVLRSQFTSIRLQLGAVPATELGVVPAGQPSNVDGYRTFVDATGAKYRVYTSRLSAELPARLEIATRLEPTERRQRQLNRNLALFGGIALVLGAAFTFFFASLLLRPLQRLRAVTASIAGDGDLDRRIPSDEGPQELRALATSFDDMLTRLARSSADRERALEATRRFAADVGHELRTPLTSVQANLSSLRRHPEIDVERRNGLLDDAMSEQRRLVALLDGLQALARGDAAPVEHARVDLAELLDQSLEAARSRYPDVRWDVTLPDDAVEVEGWSPGLRLILDNLVGNAAKHGRPGGSVRVALGAGPELCVEDDGTGVPEAERARIFEPFARLEGTVVQGSGLGLALVAQQVGHHGARLEVDDSPGLGGARFRVRFLPVSDPPPLRAGVRA